MGHHCLVNLPLAFFTLFSLMLGKYVLLPEMTPMSSVHFEEYDLLPVRSGL
jgi:hypothetical protein